MMPPSAPASPRHRRRFGVAVIATLGLFLLVAVAVAQTGGRQSASLAFEQKLPARGTGVSLAIDYVNPEDRDAKPFAVEKVVTVLPDGSQIDTSVPARCGASDAELIAQGAAACPAGSRVGGGEVSLDTGITGPARIVENDVTLLNNRDELILLLQSESEPSTRAVSRGRLDGATLTTEVPPIPGGPPDGFTAIKGVRLEVNRVSAGTGDNRRSYLTTPASCPPDGNWTTAITFTYRDAVSETVSSNSPCVTARKPVAGRAPSTVVAAPSPKSSGGGAEEILPRGGIDAGARAPAVEPSKHAGSRPGALGAVIVVVVGLAACCIRRQCKARHLAHS